MSDDDARVANIGPRQRRVRRLGGIVAGAGAVSLYIALILADAPRAWRATVAIPVWVAALGLLQSKEKT